MSDYAMVMPAPGGADDFEKRDITPPTPGPTEALIRHHAIGLNYLDVYHRSGAYPWPVDKDLVIGSEGAGVVEAVGAEVRNLAPGDRVAYTHPMGAYATLRTLPADRLVKLPDGISSEAAAAMMLKGLTAHYLINSTFKVEPGMTVLVQAAAGGVGLILGGWLAARGATSIGTAGGPEKVALAREHGYHHVIDYRAEDFVEKVREITGGSGVDVAYDGVGKDTWRGSLASLRTRGTFVIYGAASGPVEGFGVPDLARGSFSACRPTLFHYIATQEDLDSRAQALFAAVTEGLISADVHQRFDLSDAAAAHKALESRQTQGATVLIP